MTQSWFIFYSKPNSKRKKLKKIIFLKIQERWLPLCFVFQHLHVAQAPFLVSIYPFISITIHLPGYLSIYLFITSMLCISTSSSTLLSIYLSIYIYNYLSILISIYPFISISIHLSIYLSIYYLYALYFNIFMYSWHPS